MLLPVGRRCFECGATFSGSIQTGTTPRICPIDGTLLGLDMVGRVWRLEASLGPRAGGGVFIAYHQATGARAAVSLVYNAREGELEDRLNREVQALRLLEPHPNLFPMLELGIERDGTRFYVSELQTEQTLRETLKEWRRPEDLQASFAQARMLLQPLLNLLTAAHRMGVAHGELDAEQIYAALSDDGPEATLTQPRLYGLRFFNRGAALTDAMRADVLAMGQILFEMLFGELPRATLSSKEQAMIRNRYGEALGAFILQSIANGQTETGRSFARIEQMAQALAGLESLGKEAHQAGEWAICRPADPFGDMTERNYTPARCFEDCRPIPRTLGREISQGIIPPLPALPLISTSAPQKSDLSDELGKVSFFDLLALPQLPRLSPIPVVQPMIDSGEVEIEMIGDFSSEPTQLLVAASKAEPTKFKLWGWWRR